MSDESQGLLKNRYVMGGLAFTIALIAAAIIYVQVKPVRNPEGEIWYYDTESRELFSAKDQIPPIVPPNGGTATGVRAYVFTCSDCSDKSKLVIGWLETFSDENQQLLANPQGYSGLGDIGKGGRALVRMADGTEWLSERSEEGRSLAVAPKCDSGVARPCQGPNSK